MRPMIDYYYIVNIYDNQPKPVQRSIGDLWKSLQMRRHYKKLDAPLFIPVTLIDPLGGRIDSNVDTITMGCIDFDDGKLPFPTAKDMQKFPFVCCAYTTHSHTEEKPKWRFLAPLKTPIERDVWKNGGWHSMIKDYGRLAGLNVPLSYVDVACKNAARAYYYPSAPIESTAASVVWNLGKNDLWEFPIEKKKVRVYKPSRIKARGDDYNDLDTELKNNLKNCPKERASMCTLLGGRVINGKCKKWICPQCGRNDATFYFIKGRQVFCDHMNSCTYRGHSLYDLATEAGVL